MANQNCGLVGSVPLIAGQRSLLVLCPAASAHAEEVHAEEQVDALVHEEEVHAHLTSTFQLDHREHLHSSQLTSTFQLG